MVNSFKIRHATHLSLKYLALATAWIDAGTKGNPETIKGIGQTWCFWFQFHMSLPLTASLAHKTYMWNPSFHNCNPITLRTLAWRANRRSQVHRPCSPGASQSSCQAPLCYGGSCKRECEQAVWDGGRDNLVLSVAFPWEIRDSCYNHVNRDWERERRINSHARLWSNKQHMRSCFLEAHGQRKCVEPGHS